jgi:serine phosphatase RsbU (regulator of sigma subunit)
MEGTEMLVQTINKSIIAAASGGICFAPTMLGCYDTQIGVLAYINAGGQTAMLRDSEGTRPLPNASLPLGLTTHMPYEASMQAFEPGARLLVVTKGVTLSMSGKIPFGPDRIREALAESKEESADKVCHAVLQAAADFQKEGWLQRKPQVEDMTALALIRSATQ